ncbi:winged helix-turn-helix domain-containing protein [Microvirga sp. BT688]|uniref:Crp/Fnr family transcriptional regulator n=1 Tax=Microvirga sp. TaxID=1873136 RepID=UPI0016857DF1|nr:helix-turn-helix domain-containing protein [Microvirga sp.]MBD2749923.1 winged helix-turn-helix domain-containing protein [Microvirga sp.]
MSSVDLTQAMEALPELRPLLLRYIYTILVQAAPVSACNVRHPLTGRVARCLLMAHDRLEAPGLALTHEAIAKILGVRRASITVVLHELDQTGAIRVGPRQISILDRPKLESLTCYCYGVLKGAFQ